MAHTKEGITSKPGSLFHSATKETKAYIPKAHKPKRGKHLISGFFEEPTYRQFCILAAELGIHRSDLLRESLNDIFIKYTKPPIA